MESFNKCPRNMLHNTKSTDMNKHGYEDPSRTNTKINNTDNKTISDKDMRGNRGLNTQQVMNGIENRFVGRQDKTNGI